MLISARHFAIRAFKVDWISFMTNNNRNSSGGQTLRKEGRCGNSAAVAAYCIGEVTEHVFRLLFDART
jgi:hypothetical protein